MKLMEWLESVDREGFDWIAKRLSGNDTGLTAAHQAGLYLPKRFFERAVPDIVTPDRLNPKQTFDQLVFPQTAVTLNQVTATYYNNRVASVLDKRGTRNEFRLTRWGGSSCPLQDPENTGALIIFAFCGSSRGEIWVCDCPEEEAEAEAWIGSTVDPKDVVFSWADSDEVTEENAGFANRIPPGWLEIFPSGAQIFDLVRSLRKQPTAADDPDRLLEERRTLEFEIFKFLERKHVMPLIRTGFRSVDDFIDVANRVTNRRKARSGRSLELGLQAIFEELNLPHETQVVTEGRSTADFLFPSSSKYRELATGEGGCLVLAAKTCCKDRWRQVTKEARRLTVRHLFTLQEGVSANQLTEMHEAGIRLVVPRGNVNCFPEQWRPQLLSLKGFTLLAAALPE